MKNRNLDHKNDWKTPESIYIYIEQEFWISKDKLFDPCPFMHDLEKFDWLQIEWNQFNFINPPYSLDLKVAFVKKAIEESKKWKKCIMLLPVSTSTKLFHEQILPNKKDLRFLKWRVKFSWYNTKWEWVDNKCWMHDSMIVIF